MIKLVLFNSSDGKAIYINVGDCPIKCVYEFDGTQFVDSVSGKASVSSQHTRVTRIAYGPDDYVEVPEPLNFVVCKLMDGGESEWSSKRKSKK